MEGLIMFDNTMELAENKLIILYTLKKINMPISNIQLTDIILENNFMNYFNLQQYITELMSSSFIKDTKYNNKKRIIITEKGLKVFLLFGKRISDSKKEILDAYLDSHIENIKKEITITADYTIENSDNYLVNLKACECNNNTLLDIKIGVSSNKQARELCKKWKKNSSMMYKNVVRAIIEDE